MKRSEKRILLVMGVVILYGAWQLVRSAKPADANGAGRAAREAASLAGKVQKELDASVLGPGERYLLALIDQPWVGRCLEPEEPPPAQPPPTTNAPPVGATYRYDGYLLMGGARYAVIDGVEVKEGSALPDGRFVVLAVHPEGVWLEPTEGGENVWLAVEWAREGWPW